MRLVELALSLSKKIGSWPAGLASQIERSAISIPTNIAEGYGRASRAEYLHFLSISAGSLRELETHILIARGNGLVELEPADRALELADETGRILHGLRKALSAGNRKEQRWPR
jgi:four helix bundle protein